MKKAILNLGLLSMMMMLTSFTSISSEEIYSLDNHCTIYSRGNGLAIPPSRKQDFKQEQSDSQLAEFSHKSMNAYGNVSTFIKQD